jgi:hypothetical protein
MNKMNRFINRKIRSRILIPGLLLAALLLSCDTGTDPGSEESNYPLATARVDYNGANRSVFFNFADGAVSEVPHDFWDIAYYGYSSVIANSGSYGSGVQVFKTGVDAADIADDLSAQVDNVKEYTFKTGVNLYGYQTGENPLSDAASSGNVYLFKIGTNFYKVAFAIQGGPSAAYTLTVVKDLNGTSPQTVTGSLSGITSKADTHFGYIFFKIDGDTPRALNTPTDLNPGAPEIPRVWDLLFTRTNEILTEDGETFSDQNPVTGRSTILINIAKGVKAYTAEGQSIEAVLDLSEIEETAYSTAVDAIGNEQTTDRSGWYTKAGGPPPTFSPIVNTFVIINPVGKYGKFQPGSFYGPGNESFYVSFRYLFADNDTGIFDK